MADVTVLLIIPYQGLNPFPTRYSWQLRAHRCVPSIEVSSAKVSVLVTELMQNHKYGPQHIHGQPLHSVCLAMVRLNLNQFFFANYFLLYFPTLLPIAYMTPL